MTVAGLCVAAAVFGGVQLAANLGYDTARTHFVAQEKSTASALDDTRSKSASLGAATAAATKIIDANSGILIDASAIDPLSAASSSAQTTLTETESLLDTELPAPGRKDTWFWELFPASARLTTGTGAMVALTDELTTQSPRIDAANSSLTDAGTALFSAVGAAAGPFEAAHISAKNDAVIALRDAATSLATTTTLDENAVSTFVAAQDAADAVISSEQAELSEKAGPLRANRLEIEAFARSLAPGVLLEFDWSRIVNGVGDNGSMGGLTTWWWATPGRAVIELSNSVAAHWPSIASKSLVAHEVGHAISVKCQGMYDSTSQDNIEKWATAWAISMGYTDDANGVWAYGYPPQTYIDAATACR